MVDRAGQPLAGRFSEYGILTPVRSATITVRSDGGRFEKTYLRVLVMKKSIHVLEHTPIYDLDAYNQRQRRLKHKKLRKNLVEALSFLCLVTITFSILLMKG